VQHEQHMIIITAREASTRVVVVAAGARHVVLVLASLLFGEKDL